MEISIKGYNKVIVNVTVDNKLFSGLTCNHILRMSSSALECAERDGYTYVMRVLNNGEYYKYTPRTRLLKGINEHYLLLTHNKVTLFDECEVIELHNALRAYYRNKYV